MCVCVCMAMCATVCLWRSEVDFVVSVLSLCGFWEWNFDCQLIQQEPVPAEPSC